MHQSIEIKEISKKNTNELFKVFEKTLDESFLEYSKAIKQYFMKSDYFRKTIDVADIILGAFHNRQLIGYIIGQNPVGGLSLIFWLGVLKHHHRKGVGKQLLSRYEEIVKRIGGHNLRLESVDYNLEFYKKQGYEVIGFDKKGYFGTDNYVMKKLIQEPKEVNFLR